MAATPRDYPIANIASREICSAFAFPKQRQKTAPASGS